MKFEVAFDVAPGTDPGVDDWTDLSAYLAEPGKVNRGGSDGRAWSGSATLVLDDPDRDLDPTNSLSSYNLVPMRHARLTKDGTAVFRGFVERWAPNWGRYNAWTIDVDLHDAMPWFALQDVDVDLAAQTTTARITALLDAAGWPAGLRDIGAGVVRVAAYEQASANLLRLLEDTAEAEDGYLWVTAAGVVTFRSRHHRFDATSQATISSTGTGLPLVEGVAPQWDTGTLVNICRVELESGDTFEATDDTAVTAYGPFVLAIRDLALADVEATGLAQWFVYRYAEPRYPDGDPKLWLEGVTTDAAPADVLGLDYGDLVTFSHDLPNGDTVTSVGHIEQIVTEVRAGRWATVFALSPYFGAGPWMQWYSDAATEGSAWLSDAATVGAKWAP